jgi:hypothetical protein
MVKVFNRDNVFIGTYGDKFYILLQGSVQIFTPKAPDHQIFAIRKAVEQLQPQIKELNAAIQSEEF